MSWTTQYGNPTRTSYTSIDRADTAMVGHAYMEFEPYIGTWVQPVSNADGTVVFFPAADGVRAIDIDPSKAPYMSVRWGFPTRRPVEDTVAFHEGHLYFTCLDHRIYKVDADTGAEIWSWEGPAGFSVNPLVVTVSGDVMVFAGCRNGVFYALLDEGSSAAKVWEYDTGYPILNSATANADSDATVVWWCSMGGYVYRASAADGQDSAQSAKLLTAGFRTTPLTYDSVHDLLYVPLERNWKQATHRGPGTWAVDQSILPTSLESWWLRNRRVEGDPGVWHWKRVSGVDGPWPGGASSTVIDLLQNPDSVNHRRPLGMYDDPPEGDGKAEYRNLVILDATTMAEKTWDFGDGVQRRAPIINHDGHTRPRPPVAVLPDGTALFYMLSIDQQYITQALLYRWVPGSRYAWPVPGSQHNQDEAMYLSVGPDWADSPYGWEFSTDGNKHSSASGGKASFPTNFDDFNPRCGSTSYFVSPHDSSMGTAYLAFGGSKGIYCALQPFCPHVLLSDTCVVMLAYNCLVMWTTAGTPDKARVGSPVPRMDTSAARSLHSGSTADVRSKLEAEVAKVLSLSGGNKLLRPAYVAHSNLDKTCENEPHNIPYNLQYERDLARTYVALCNAAEHVSDPAPIKAYIKWLWQNYPPYTNPGLIAWTGEAREWSTIPDGAWKDGDGNSRNLETDWVTFESGPWGWNPYRVYAAMRVCQILADDPAVDPAVVWDHLFEHSNGSGVFTDTFAYEGTSYETDHIDKKDALIACYAAGMVGAKWICEQVGDTERAAQCEAKLAGLAQKYDDAWTNPARPLGAAGTADPYPLGGLGNDIGWKNGRMWNLSRWWYWMTPEFAEYLKANHADIVTTIRRGIAEYWSLAPYWYLAHFHAALNEATMGPLHDRSMLQGLALFNETVQRDLFSVVDIPAYVGDMLYIQNLVAVLEAPTHAVPAFGTISVPGTVSQYGTLEITFDLSTDTTNLFLPYDPTPPTGQGAVGITVDAQFTDPYGEAHTVAAFYYRHFTTERRNNRDWIYPDPSGDTWKIRFTPTVAGTWSVVLAVEDAGGSAASEVYTIEVQESARPGFIQTSLTDARYFQRENGTYFSGLGFNTAWQEFNWNNPTTTEARIRSNADYGVNLLRYWPSEMPLFGGLINPLRQWDADQTGDTEPAISLFDADNQPGPGYSAEVMWRLHTTRGSNFTRFLALGWLTEPLAVKPDTTYRISLKLLIPQDLQPTTAGDAGFVIKSHPGWLDADQVVSNKFGKPQSAYHLSTAAQWQDVSCLYTTSSSENYLPWLYFALVNVMVDEKIVYFDDVQIAESLGEGRYGPNLFDKGVASQHEYVSQRYSWAMDRFLSYAEQHGVALKLVLLEKNDSIFCRIGENGSVEAGYSNDNFYGPADQSVTRSRWLQRAFWRYCQARWGNSVAVHSWELCNEGDPGSVRHYNLAQFMAAYFNAFTANHHPSTTSFWAGFPAKEFWKNSNYPDIGYADLHRYVYESEPEWNDTARAHIDHAMQLPSTGQPVARGETMVVESDTSSYAKLLLRDTGGIWLKHWLWSQLHWNQLYELFWYARQVITGEDPPGKDQRGHFLALARFLEGIPLHNGNYEDIRAISEGYLVVGQKDRINNRAHLWVRADGEVPCTWVNVVNKAPVSQVTSDIIIPDMTPKMKYAVSSIDTSNGMSVMDSVTVPANKDGLLILRSSQLKALRGLTGDVALKVESGKGAKREVKVSTHKYRPLGTMRTYMNVELDGLPDGANRTGQPVNFTIDRAMYMAVELSIAEQAGPRSPGAQIAIYAIRSVDDVNYGYGGDDLDPPPTDLLCTLALDPSPEARLLTMDGLRAPATRAKILVKNLTGQPLGDSGNTFRYRLYTTISETEAL